MSYTAPDASMQTVGNDTFDVWIGTTQIFNDVAAKTATVDLTDIKFAFTEGNATIDLDNIVIDTFPTDLPTLATGGITTLSGFGYNEGMGPSSSQFVTLSATNLSPSNGNVTVSPPANYEISIDDLNFTSSPLSISYVAGSIPQTPVTKIYVRLKAGLAANNYNGESITIEGGDAVPVTVTCNGIVTKADIILSALTTTAMNYPLGAGPSASINSKVSGTFLNGNVTIIPDDNSIWEVSADNTIWGNSAVYVPVGGVLKANENKVYIRLKQGLAIGTYNGEITASSLYADSEILSIIGEVVKPIIQLNESEQDITLIGFDYDFAQGPSTTQTVRVDGFNLSDVITINASANWEISSNATYSGGNLPPFSTVTFGKNASDKTLYIRLKNGLSVGYYTGVVTFTSPFAVTRTVNVSGTVSAGKVDMKVLGGTNAINDGSTQPSSLNRTQFATRNIGHSQTKTYTITNKGGAHLILGEINLTGANSVDFYVDNAPEIGTELLQNQSVNFDITFEPSTVGAKLATVEIENNDPDNNPYDFVIGGKANFCGATGTFVIAQQGFEEVSEFEELTYTPFSSVIYGSQTGFSIGKSASNDKPSLNNLYSEGDRGYRIQGGSAPNSLLTPYIFDFDEIDTSIYSNIELSLRIAAFSLGSSGNGMDNLDSMGTETTIDSEKIDFVLIEISPDNGTTWYQQAKVVSDNPNLAWGFGATGRKDGSRNYVAANSLTYFKSNNTEQYKKITISNLPAVPQLKIRISVQDNTAEESWIIDDIRLVSTGIVPKVWDGSAWLPSTPVKSDKAIINGAYNTLTSGDLQVCQCEVNSPGKLTIAGGNNVVVSDILVNNGEIVVENDGNFTQVNEAGINSGTGTFTVKRNSNLKRLDYTYWASPVAGQNLKSFSPGTVNSRFYIYNEGNDEFEVINPLANVFGKGLSGFESAAKGYAIRADNNYTPATQTDPAPMNVFEGIFKGTVNNGPFTFPLQYKSMTTGNGYNLVGNPYASNINFYKLANNNKPVIYKRAYFWTNLNPNPGMQGNNYPNGGFYNNYAIRNGTGGIPATLGSTATTSDTPTNIIKVGQGFLVEVKKAGPLTFKNAMRTANTNSVFFNRELTEDKEVTVDRFWLHLTTPLQVTTTALVGYLDEATNDFDEDYDAPLFGLGADALFTTLEDRKLGIQGRKYPFHDSDVIPVGTSHYADGNYTFTLGKREGIFLNGQNVYLKDLHTGIFTNLSQNNYSFSANKGLTAERFKIIYRPEDVLGINHSVDEDLVIYRDGNYFVLKSSQKIKKIDVYDGAGRLIFTEKFNENKVRINILPLNPGIYFLQIIQDGKTIIKKVLK